MSILFIPVNTEGPRYMKNSKQRRGLDPPANFVSKETKIFLKVVLQRVSHRFLPRKGDLLEVFWTLNFIFNILSVYGIATTKVLGRTYKKKLFFTLWNSEMH